MSLAQTIFAAMQASQSADIGERQAAIEQLRNAQNADPSAFLSVCAEVLVNTSAPLASRLQYGYMLKQAITHLSSSVNAQLQAAILNQAVKDPEVQVRRVACSLIPLAVRRGLWPLGPVLQSLCQTLAQHCQGAAGSPSALAETHGAVRALSHIVEDSIEQMDREQMTGEVLRATMPYLSFQDFDLSDVIAREVRGNALSVVNLIAEQAGMDPGAAFSYRCLQPVVVDILGSCVQIVAQPDVSPGICVECLRFMNLSLLFHESISDDVFNTILGVMFEMTRRATQNQSGTNEEIGIEAANFWGVYLTVPRFKALAEPGLPGLIPMLIECMMYSDMEIGMMPAKPNDFNVPDKEDDIKPRHYVRKNTSREDDGGGEGDGDGGDDDDDDEVEENNLRRTSARALDAIAEFYGDSILGPVLTVVSNKMQSDNWRQVEAAVLAIGAISDGCIDALMQYAPDIAARLLQLLNAPDTHFLVVVISLWTSAQLQRYFTSAPEALRGLLDAMLRHMQSPSKMVQESATENLGTLVECCDDGQLDAFVGQIVESIAVCMQAYQLKNRVTLLEFAVITSDCLGASLRSDEALASKMIDTLGRVWMATPNTSRLIFSVFEAMSHLCTALGPLVQPLAQTVFERAFGLLAEQVPLRQIAFESNMEPEDPAYLITPTDLLCGLFDALGSSLEPLVAGCPALPSYLSCLLMDPVVDVRTSGFGLTGDLSKACPQWVQMNLEMVGGAALRNLVGVPVDADNCAVASNIAWTFCNLLECQVEADGLPTVQSAGPLFDQLFHTFAQVLGGATLTHEMRNMAENISILLGMMLYLDSEVETRTGVTVAAFSRPFCEYMRNVKESYPQREMAVKGYLLAVQRLPLQQSVLPHLSAFFDLATALIGNAEDDTLHAMHQVLGAAKQSGGGVWASQLRSATQYTQQKLSSYYGV